MDIIKVFATKLKTYCTAMGIFKEAFADKCGITVPIGVLLNVIAEIFHLCQKGSVYEQKRRKIHIVIKKT